MIEAREAEGALTLTLNRPDKANALTEAMLIELAERVAGAKARLLILTGAGRVFSAGADLDAARAGLAVSPAWERLSGAVAAFPGLSVAALNGTCAGGAMGMMLACDLRIAAAHATFFYPVMKLGYLPQPSDPARLRALVGPARAKLLLMGGQKLGAQEALAAGLIDRIAEEPHAAAMEIGADARSAGAEHVAAIKAMVSRAIP